MSKNILYTTSLNFHIGEAKLPVLENSEKDLFVLIQDLYPNGSIAKEYIRPILWGNQPHKSNNVDRSSNIKNKFKHECISLGKKLEDFKYVNYSRTTSIEVEENLVFEVVNLRRQVDDLKKELKSVSTKASNNRISVDGMNEELSNTSKELLHLSKTLTNFWYHYTNLFSTLRHVFKSKKWKKRFSKQNSDFYEEIKDSDVFPEDNLPF